MKKFIIFLLFMPQLFYGQWVQTNTNYLGNFIDLHCISEQVVVVVGLSGKIIKTIDGGQTWLQKQSNTTQSLNKIQFIDTNVGYAVGDNATVLKTIDGGNSWIIIQNVESNNFTDLSLGTENIFYVVCDGAIKKTINGGNTFTNISLPTTVCTNIQFLDDNVGYFCGQGSLYKTIDGGISWSFKNNILDQVKIPFYFVNDTIGFINSNGFINKTTDSGLTLNQLNQISNESWILHASNENLYWSGAAVSINGNNCYTARGEIVSGNTCTVAYKQPCFWAFSFFNMVGYSLTWGGNFIYKNTTSLMDNELSTFNPEINPKFVIAPNPTKNYINIKLNDEINAFTVIINDTLGNTIFVQNYHNTNEAFINISSFQKGMYLLTIKTNINKQTQKLIIN